MRTSRWAAIVLASFAAAAHAGEAMQGGDTRWRCWYAPDAENPVIACRVLQAPATAASEAEAAPAARPLPPIVRRIRGDPQSFLDEIVVIPLHAPPIDMRLAARLASSVMCGGRPACSVDFGNEPGG